MAKLSPDKAGEVAPLIRPALEAIESRWGVITDLSTYRISFEALAVKAGPIYLPIAPVVSLESIQVDGREVPAPALWRGILFPQREQLRNRPKRLR